MRKIKVNLGGTSPNMRFSVAASATVFYAWSRGTSFCISDDGGQIGAGELQAAGFVVVQIVGLQFRVELGLERLDYPREAGWRERFPHAEPGSQPIGHCRLPRSVERGKPGKQQEIP
jgi:hypothetical protein